MTKDEFNNKKKLCFNLGRKAFLAGFKRAPTHDRRFIKQVRGIKLEESKVAISLTKEWLSGFDNK